MYKIIIIDDDMLVKTSLKTILETSQEVQILAMGSNGHEAFELYKQHQPDIVLMDIKMPIASGIEGAKQILQYDPEAKILLLTTFADEEYIAQAIQLKISGYLLKQNFESIIPAFKNITNGQIVYSNIMLKSYIGGKNNQADTISEYSLTDLEILVIEEVAKGNSNKLIAQNLSFSEGYIRNLISTILAKLNLENRVQLVMFYYEKLK